MKTLDEKKLLAKMARGIGKPDYALEESIRLEEELNNKLFAKPKPVEPKTPIFKEAVVVAPSGAEAPPKEELVQQTINAIKPSPLQQKLQSSELDGVRRQIAELTQKLGTLSWGGGGTGVVRFLDLDDHRHPQDIKILSFNTDGPEYPPLPGSLSWNPAEDCLDIMQSDGTVLQTGLESYIRVTNHTGNTLNSGILVSFAGVNGTGNPSVIPLLANDTFPPIYTVGVLTEDIANNRTGRATTFGKVRQIDTTGSSVGETWTVGDLLYASPTYAGQLTKVKPTAPNVAISIAAVMHVGQTDGEILVRPTITPRLYYGSFSDKTTQTAPASNTAHPMHFNTTEFSSGHRVVTYNGEANSAIQADFSGLYNYQFSSQFQSSSSARARIWIWARKNGTDIPDSATVIAIESNGGVTAPAWNFVVSMNAGDKFQLMWATDEYTKVSMIYQGATAFCPAIPSVLLSVTQVQL